MATTLQNTPIELDPNELATFQGWTISNGTAFHSGCFAGIITLLGIDVIPDTSYIIRYNISSYSSGNVYPIVGGVNGTSESSLGQKEATIVVPEDATDLTIKFYSDGELGIEYMNIFPVLSNPDNAVTVAFNPDENKWSNYYSWHPQMMLKFVNDLFSWDQLGQLWQHNVNPVRNNFYGTQSYSEIQLIFNVNVTAVKNLYSNRVNSNLPWELTEIYIRPTVGRQDGQRSKIPSGNYVNINGQWFADFLKNMDDPRFNDELQALFNGGDLQCTSAKITIRNYDTTEVRLVTMDFLGAIQQYSY